MQVIEKDDIRLAGRTQLIDGIRVPRLDRRPRYDVSRGVIVLDALQELAEFHSGLRPEARDPGANDVQLLPTVASSKGLDIQGCDSTCSQSQPRRRFSVRKHVSWLGWRLQERGRARL